jgi:hypothetical protein
MFCEEMIVPPLPTAQPEPSLFVTPVVARRFAVVGGVPLV